MSSSSKLSEFTQRAVSVFRECSLIPAATRARIFPRDEATGCFEIEATWSQRELERGKKVSFTKSYFVQRKGQALEKLCNSTFQSDATQVYDTNIKIFSKVQISVGMGRSGISFGGILC